MITTNDLIEFLEERLAGEITEKKDIIIHRLKYLDQIKEEVSNSYSGIVASELFENNDL